jgi:hypothetical protein
MAQLLGLVVLDRSEMQTEVMVATLAGRPGGGP